MRAMLLHKQGHLSLEEIDRPKIEEDQLLLKVKTCAICRTDLHILDKELPYPKLPLILGHQIVGIVEEIGKKVTKFAKGDRVGVSWLAKSCRVCEFCKEGKENLCNNPLFTGYTHDGGLAEYTSCYAEYVFPLPDSFSDIAAAPLLCAGMIGYRSYCKASPKNTIGLYGFGSAAHLLLQLALFEKKEVYAFTREGDKEGALFAKKLGAHWAGSAKEKPPVLLDAAIIFAPAGELLPLSLQALKKGGRCICGGIHMSDIPSFPYKDLWEEKRIESVANLTRKDGFEYLALATKAKIKTATRVYPLEKANEALQDLKEGKNKGSAVIQVG